MTRCACACRQLSVSGTLSSIRLAWKCRRSSGRCSGPAALSRKRSRLARLDGPGNAIERRGAIRLRRNRLRDLPFPGIVRAGRSTRRPSRPAIRCAAALSGELRNGSGNSRSGQGARTGTGRRRNGDLRRSWVCREFHRGLADSIGSELNSSICDEKRQVFSRCPRFVLRDPGGLEFGVSRPARHVRCGVLTDRVMAGSHAGRTNEGVK